MFWGVRLLPGRKYSQEVTHSYQITKAVLETPVDLSSKAPSKRVHVMLFHEDQDQEFVLATLDQGNVERNMDLHFSQGEKVCFFLKGEGTVHLSGYIVDFDDDGDEEYSDEENPFVSADEFAKAASKRGFQENGSDAQAKKAKLMNENENDDDDDDEEDHDFLGTLDEEYDSMDDEDGEFDELDEESDLLDEDHNEESDKVLPQKKQNGLAKPQQQKNPQIQKPQQQQQQQKKPNQNQPTPQNQKSNQKQKKQNQPNQQQTPQNKFQQQQKQQSQKKGQQTPQQQRGQSFVKKTPDGLEIRDNIIGSGPIAKRGKTVYVKYIGRLSNNKEFDRSANKPFSFRLGSGEVIQGWEKGIEGMRVGGKRLLSIPPKLGYGSQKSGPIPANSQLNFEVELVRVV